MQRMARMRCTVNGVVPISHGHPGPYEVSGIGKKRPPCFWRPPAHRGVSYQDLSVSRENWGPRHHSTILNNNLAVVLKSTFLKSISRELDRYCFPR